ncbi:P-loop containing nucleoside triphosphate hydrolase [Pseudocohnilembus persalinus]|uniref:p-loop containing nucleoside triphosphate hydrolase n=1 Tax=Pseudocohnilembus persalinus TaxID=266149 RepID=A0A0V0QJY9_PSEPJ|nr:P-loop containing nucleoside triphosphate hydrolase [Pseudocohnilembus persalinus]|eukprot:KRX02396.1 P-loop containing nucleoside triphosphate hydrolase [Pseudocohnilembus persalinus]
MNTETKQSIGFGPLQKYKIVFLGDQSVGKTSIINRYMFDTFDGKNQPTVGIDFISKSLYFEDRQIRLQLWDTAGQERFRSLIPSYIRDSAVAVICYDISNRLSFQNAPKWIDDVRAERGPEVIVCLIGNKQDLEEQRQVSQEEAQQKAKELDVIYLEVSAKTGNKVQHLFKVIASSLPGAEVSQLMQNPLNQSVNNGTSQKSDNFQLESKNQQQENDKKKKSGCC